MTNAFIAPRPVPTLITLLAVITMGWLGVWQLQRLEWKQGLIAKIEAGRTLPPLTSLPADTAEWPALEFRRVVLRGHFPHGARTFKAIATRNSKAGFTLVTPFVLADGRSILVNRGFIPQATHELPAAKEHEITGLLRTSPKRPAFLPADDVARNMWFTVNIPAMSEQAGIPALPAYIERIGEAVPDVYPSPSNGDIVLRNDHLGYAITWFSIAIAAIVIFVLYHRKPTA